MAFSFNEPTTTHPSTENVENVTTEERKDDVPADNPADAGTDVQSGNDNQAPENAGGEASGADAGEGNGEPNGEPKPDDSASVAEGEFYFGGEAVTIEIPSDVDAALKEKGLDANAIVSELYAKDGDFSLSEETKSKLYEAFGKFAVDAYLSGLKAQNEGFMLRHETAAREAEAANAQRFTDIASTVGGEEGWSKLEGWALENLSDDELTAFNAVMESGNMYLQQYAVRELEGRRKAAMGDDNPNLIEPSATATATEDNSPLSRDQYIREIAQLGSKFGRDRKALAEAQAKLDARRRAGMAKGI